MKTHAKPKRHLFLTKNFILMLVLVVLIIMSISAWFSFNKTVDASNMVVKAVSTQIDIAESIKTYNSNYEVQTDGPGEFVSTLNIDGITLTKDCTGNGMNLIVPEFNVTKDYESVRKNGGKEVNTNLTPATATSSMASDLEKLRHPDQDAPEYQYFQYEFYVRSTNPDLMLNAGTELVSSTEAGGGSLGTVLSTGDPKRSAYGDFNVDGLVGAIRVSLVGQACSSVNQSWSGNNLTSTSAVLNNGGPVRQLLWIPRPDIHLDVNQNEGDISNWSLSTGVTSSQYSGETYRHDYYQQTENGVELVTDNTAVVSSDFTGSVPTLGQSVNISNFSSYSTAPGMIDVTVDKSAPTVKAQYYVTKYTLKVWIEGTDSEARRAMDGGTFNLNLYFE